MATFFTKETDTSSLPEIKKSAKTSIPILNITTKGVEKLLKNIKEQKANGPDNIANIILKNCSSQLAPGLREIFQLSMDSGQLPSD